MRGHPRRCGNCAAIWTQSNARYCGWCGSPLHSHPLTPGRGRPWRRIAAIGAGTVAAVAATAALAAGINVVVPRGTDPDVELPATKALPAESPLSTEEATTLRQQVDPNRLRCEPRGCEVWRRPLGRWHDSGVVDGIAILLEERHLIGLDVATGDEAWQMPLSDVFSDLPQVTHERSRWVGHAGSEGVVVGVGAALALVAPDGTVRWTTPYPDVQLWYAELHEPVLLLNGETTGGRPFAAALRVADGVRAWERQGAEMYSTAAGRVLLSTGTGMEVVDLVDGTRVWTSGREYDWDDHATDVWLLENHVVVAPQGAGSLEVVDLEGGDRWEASFDPRGWPTVADTWVSVPLEGGEEVVRRLSDGAILTRFPGRRVVDWTSVGDRAVLLLAPASTFESESHSPAIASLLALDRDGGVAWRLPVETANCCGWLWHDGSGAVAVQADEPEGQRTHLRVDVATGELLAVAGDGWAPDGWTAEDGTWIEWDRDWLALRKGDLAVRVHPNGSWPRTDGEPWVFATESEMIGVRLMPAEDTD